MSLLIVFHQNPSEPAFSGLGGYYFGQAFPGQAEPIGLNAFTADGALTGAAASFAATGVETFRLTGAEGSAASSLDGAGRVWLAVGSITFPGASLAGTGTELFSATGAITFPPATLGAAGTETNLATGAVTGAAASLSGTGSVPMPISCVGAVTSGVPRLRGRGRGYAVEAGGPVLDLGGYAAFVNQALPPEEVLAPTFVENDFTVEQGPAAPFQWANAILDRHDYYRPDLWIPPTTSRYGQTPRRVYTPQEIEEDDARVLAAFFGVDLTGPPHV